MTNQNKKVLVITYSFPPKPRVASVRMQGLARYLPTFGWDPTFITVELPGEPEKGFRVIQTPDPGDVTEHIKRLLGFNPKAGLQDQLGVPDHISMQKESPTGKIVTGIKAWITYPDKRKYWRPLALKALRELFAKESFHALISSSPPVITHLIAKRAQMEFSIPWVADFRDLWTGNHYYPYGPIRKRIDRGLEIRTIDQAAALITVSEPLGESLKALHGHEIVKSIPNGFDPVEVKAGELHDKFTFTYTGQLYQGKRDPEVLFKIVHDLLQEDLLKDDIQIKFYGDKVYWLDQLIEDYGLEKVAFQCGTVDRSEALLEQRSSQILLSLNWDHPLEKGVYTGKIFEYLAAQRPILALGGPQGVVSDLLEETQAGIHPRTEAELRSAILSWYEEFQHLGYVSYQGNEQIHNYSHLKMAQRFSDVLNEVGG